MLSLNMFSILSKPAEPAKTEGVGCLNWAVGGRIFYRLFVSKAKIHSVSCLVNQEM